MTTGESRAFPYQEDGDQHRGLTKREYFAAMAMQGFLAAVRDADKDEIADWAVRQADALIERLNK